MNIVHEFKDTDMADEPEEKQDGEMTVLKRLLGELKVKESARCARLTRTD